MEQAFANKLSTILVSHLTVALLLFSGSGRLPAAQESYGPNILPAGTFDSVKATYVPWAGVDDKGQVHGLEGKAIAVNDEGKAKPSLFGPCAQVVDLNGDGKQDLLVADTVGFFWYFPNSGTPQNAVFTQGDVMPIWLGEEASKNGREGVTNVVPRFQMVDLGGKKYDVMAGTYTGKLFHIPNVGSGTQAVYQPTVNRDQLLVATRKAGMLWCNYLSPFFTNAFGTVASLDMVMGEGTYSANSIYLLRNRGSNGTFTFDQEHTTKIIPGMGLEQITPVVVDWNNDGKPDVLCGSRTGYLVLYLNNSTDPSNPTFDAGVHIKIGPLEKLGTCITVALADLTGNKLPNLVIGKDDGTVSYALNTGSLGSPVFNTLTPLKGVLPPEYHYIAPLLWWKNGCWGAPYEMLACVNSQVEPDLKLPYDDEKPDKNKPAEVHPKNALKFYVWPYKSRYFPDRFYPAEENWESEHILGCSQNFTIKLNTRYRLHFWTKSEGSPSELRVRLDAGERSEDNTYQAPDFVKPVSPGSSWTEFTQEIKATNTVDPAVKTWGYRIEFRFKKQAPFYIYDLELQEIK